MKVGMSWGAFSFNTILISRLVLPANLSPMPLTYVLHEKRRVSWVCKVQLARNMSRDSEGLFFHLPVLELPHSRHAPLPIYGVNGREELRACGHYNSCCSCCGWGSPCWGVVGIPPQGIPRVCRAVEARAESICVVMMVSPVAVLDDLVRGNGWKDGRTNGRTLLKARFLPDGRREQKLVSFG